MLDTDHTATQMGHDLHRLSRNGITEPVAGTNTCQLTADRPPFAVFCTKLQHRLLRRLLDANAPPAPAELRDALNLIDKHVHAYLAEARLGETQKPQRSKPASGSKINIRVGRTKLPLGASSRYPHRRPAERPQTTPSGSGAAQVSAPARPMGTLTKRIRWASEPRASSAARLNHSRAPVV